MELGLVRKVDIDSEMQQSYLDYAMSVIVSRALPDARDGLKPVQRRILYAMYDMGLRPNTEYKKSARIVGEVLGKYHPHGDMAVYDAMARLAQDFSLRYPLVDGQGNFGSVDGDPPAAMRYTEARLTAAAMEMIKQIEQNTVDFSPNFDDTLTEPEVLPAAIPNLLVNGATGIAVGMATNIPPHNLTEVIHAVDYMLEHWEHLDDLTVDDLMRFIQGPDFPTGGVILQDPQGDGLVGAYATGRGRVILQARAHLEEMGRGRSRIIVTELPYMTNKAALIERIAELVREGHLEGVADLRDESDRQGMRIVIELSKAAEPEKILRELYRRTPMQSTFGINLLALVDGEPHLLSLKQALRVYIEHRLTVIRRRSEYDLEKARARAHILEGLRIALQNLDEIIQLIRNSADVEQARRRLMTRFRLSELQAQAILEMPLRRLAALERKKIEQEYKEVTAHIKELEALLRSPQKMRQVLEQELDAIKQTYGDKRRTQIVSLKEGETIASMLTTEDVTPAEEVWVSVNREGKIHRFGLDELKGRATELAPYHLVRASTHHTLYLVSASGKAAAVAVHSIPVAGEEGEGASIAHVSPLADDEPLAALFALPPRMEKQAEQYILTVTAGGMVKKSAITELPGPSSQTFILARVNEGDRLGWAFQTNGQAEVMLATAQGMSIRFHESEVRPMGLVAAGVGGMKLGEHDRVVAAEVLMPEAGCDQVLLLTADGRAKRVALKEFPLQSRYGVGVIAWKLSKGAELVGLWAGRMSSQLLFYTRNGAWQQFGLEEAAFATRAGQGKMIANLALEDQILGAIHIGEADTEATPPAPPKKGRKAVPKPAPSPATKAAAGGEILTRRRTRKTTAVQAELFTAAPEETPKPQKPRSGAQKTSAARPGKKMSSDLTPKSPPETDHQRVKKSPAVQKPKGK